MYNINVKEVALKYELSKLEQVMFAYDYARLCCEPSFYSNNTGNEMIYRSNDSKDLFQKYLDELGINYRVVNGKEIYNHEIIDMHGDSTEKSYPYEHNKIAIHIKDYKYSDKNHKVDGIFYFDIDVLSSDFSLFAKSYPFFKEYDKKNKIVVNPNDIGSKEFVKNFNDAVEQFYDTVLFDSYDALDESWVEAINCVSSLIDGKKALNLPKPIKSSKTPSYNDELLEPSKNHYELPMSIDEIDDKINHYDLLFDREIYAEDLIESLLKVYEVEYILGFRDEREYNFNNILAIILNSGWNFSPKSGYVNYEKNKLEENLKSTLNKFLEYCDNNAITKFFRKDRNQNRVQDKMKKENPEDAFLPIIPPIVKEIIRPNTKYYAYQEYLKSNYVGERINQVCQYCKPVLNQKGDNQKSIS